MARAGRSASLTEKARAYQLIEVEGLSIRAAAREVGYHYNAVGAWRKEWAGDAALAARLAAGGHEDDTPAGAGPADGGALTGGEDGESPTLTRLRQLWGRLDAQVTFNPKGLDAADRPRKGRPCLLLDDEVRWAWLSALAAGLSYEKSAGAAGITAATARRWRALAAQKREPYATWQEVIEMAEARGELILALDVKSGRPGWQGPAWLLERRRAADWMRRQVIGGNTREALADLDDDELDAMVEQMEAVKRAATGEA